MGFIMAIKGEIKKPVAVTPADIDADNTGTEVGNCMGRDKLGSDHARRLWVGVDNGSSGSDVTVVLAEGGEYIARNCVLGEWIKMPPFRNVQSTGTEGGEISVASIWD